MMKFTVLRDHLGDRAYRAGEVREAEAHDVAHLVGMVLRPLENKADVVPENKARAQAAAKPRAKAQRVN